MDNFWALSASRRALCRYIRIEGDYPPGGILLVPHFIGLEASLQRLSLLPEAQTHTLGYYYKPMHNSFWDSVVERLRRRFGAVGFATNNPQHSLLSAVRYCRAGNVLCYLPDIDPRARKSTVYVPFMAVEQAATTTGLFRLAKAARVPIVPVIISSAPDQAGYIIKLLPPLPEFPSGDDVADAARMNQFIGVWVEKMPENYFWLHRRFKTGADGNTKVYD